MESRSISLPQKASLRFATLMRRPNLTIADAKAIEKLAPSVETVDVWLGQGPGQNTQERVYYRARRKPGRRLAFQWFSRRVRFRTRREVLRFVYCHEFFHWYLREVRGGKASAETACDRFALAHFRARNAGVDWSAVLPGYDPTRRPLKRAA